jgi:hypothetical protein
LAEIPTDSAIVAVPAYSSAPPSAAAVQPAKPQRLTSNRATASSMFGDRYAKHLPTPTKVAPKKIQQPPRQSLDQETSTSAAGEELDTALQRKIPTSEPAFRVKILECITIGWPYANISDLDEVNLRSETLVAEIPSRPPWKTREQEKIKRRCLDWAFGVAPNEVWSVKKSAILLLGTILSRERCISRDVESAVQFILDSYNNNSKHAQVREACISSLRTLLSSIDFATVKVIKDVCPKIVRQLIVIASSDNSPGVLEEIQLLRNFWSSLHSVSETNYPVV